MAINTENIPWAEFRLQETVECPTLNGMCTYHIHPSKTRGSSRDRIERLENQESWVNPRKWYFLNISGLPIWTHSDCYSNHKTPNKLTATTTASTRPRTTSQTNLQQGKWEESPSTSWGTAGIWWCLSKRQSLCRLLTPWAGPHSPGHCHRKENERAVGGRARPKGGRGGKSGAKGKPWRSKYDQNMM